MSEIQNQPIEGVIVDDRDRIEDFCQGAVESMTDRDWADVPLRLRADLRTWAREFLEWAREARENETREAR